MKKQSVVFCLFLLGIVFFQLPRKAFAQSSGASSNPSSSKGSKASKKPSTKLYEEDSGSTVSGKVKVVREIQEETEVFLNVKSGSSGPFVVPRNMKDRAGALKILNASQKPDGSSVVLELDDQQRVLSVQESSSGGSGNTSAEQWGF